MVSKIRAGVFFGGPSVEHEVSVITAMQAIRALDPDRYQVIPVYVSKQGDFYTGEHLASLESYRNIPAALGESHRILKPGGLLLLSDVCFMPGDGLRQLVENCGFSVLHQEDMTALWREYYIEALWAGTADCVPCGKKCTYQLLIGRKE